MRQVLSSAVVSLLVVCGASAQGSGSAFSVTNFKLISEQRASRTESYYTYQADLVNTGNARTAVTAIVKAKTSNVSAVVDRNRLHFAPVPASGKVPSADSFTILVDRTVPFDFTQLEWTFDAPVANAGPHQTTSVGRTVYLNGGGSTNPSGVGALTYSWKFVSRPPGTATKLNAATGVAPSFVVDVPGTYKISLTVDNGAGTDTAFVSVSTTNSQPVANAGPAQTVPIGSLVTLNGSASSDVDGDPLSYSWQLISVPAGSTAVLAGPTLVNPTFVADKKGSYIAQLVVNDGGANSVPVTVTVTTLNTPPVAHAGDEQSVAIDSLVQLNGAGSTDVDGDTLRYSWALISIPSGSSAVLSRPTTVNPTFTADKPGAYVAQLIVFDGTVESTPSTTTINTDAPLQAPTADAGPGQTVLHGTTVTLHGKGNDPQGLPLAYTWSIITKPVGSQAVLSATDIPEPKFVADLPGIYVAQLFVGNGSMNSAPSTVTITTTNTAPVAKAGTDQIVIPGQLVNLSATGSVDADNDPLTYSWSFNSRPNGSTAALQNPTGANPSFVADVPGTYVVQLIVRDAFAPSVPATVMITANLLTITLKPDPLVLSNAPGTMTVELSAPAGPGGQVVHFAVVDPTVATVPAQATVPANSTGVNITVLPGVIGSTLMTASAPGYRLGAATIEVRKPTISISLSAPTVGLTRQITGTVTLSAPAPPSGTNVTLTSNPAGIVSFAPPSLNIPPGASSGTFTLTGLAEGSATLSASSAGFFTGAVQVSVGRLGVIYLPPDSSIVLGASTPVQVYLVSPAPVGGAVISLQSSDPSRVTITPATVTIPEGSTVPVSLPQATGVSAGSSTISASSPGFTGDSTVITVRLLGTIQLPAGVSVPPGGSTFVAINLSAPAPAGGVTISLVSSAPATASLSTPSVFVDAGATTPAAPPQVQGILLGNATITASALGYPTATAAVTVGAALSFSQANMSVMVGTAPSATLNLSAPAPAGGVPITLISGNPSVATVPATTTIPAGALSVAVPITGVASGITTITASSPAPNVSPASMTASVQSTGSVTGPSNLEVALGGSVPILLTLPVPAPSGGLALNLVSSDGTTVGLSAASVVVPAGQTQPSTAPLALGLKPGSANLTISATGYSPITVLVKVNASIQFTPASLNIAGITSGNLTLTLSGPAPVGGLAINLSSTDTNIATVPPTVSFAAGGTTVSVPVTAVATGTTTIKASAPNLAETTAQVNVRPPSDIVLPSGLVLSPGESVVFKATLASPAVNPVFLSLTVSDGLIAKFNTSTVYIASGQTEPAASARIEGLTPGEVTVTASAPGLAPASTTVKVGYSLSFTPNTHQVTAGATRNATLVLSAPAPAGGLTVNLQSSNTAAATVNPSVTIPANNTSVNVVVTGVAPGTAEIRANASGIPQAVATITVVNPGTLSMPATLNVQLNQSAPLAVALSSPAPSGGVTVTLSSANASKATVAPLTVFIAQGQTAPATPPQVTGVNVGPVTITATAPGYTTASTVVQVAAAVHFIPESLTMNPGTTRTILLALNTSAPWGDGLTVNLTSTDTSVFTVQPSVNFFPDGSNITTVVIPITAVGPGTAQIKASGINIPEAAATITVVGPLTFTTTTLPDGLVGSPYSHTLLATGGLEPRTWTLTAGTLPANLTLNGSTGTISGTPNAVITATPLTFRVADSSNPQQIVSRVLTLTIKLPQAASIAATAGTPQSVKINTTFPLPLTATVKDANGQGVSGLTVTFTAPQNGASGSFPGGLKTATATTNASGVATSPVLTAGSVVGTYNVTASVPGVAAPANFSLTNLVGSAASIASTSGTPQHTTVNTAFPAPLVVTVKDAGDNPVPNVVVTFSAPGSGASGTFNGGVNTATTNASGVATSAVFQANGSAGSYNVTATVAGVAGSAVFALTNDAAAAASIIATGGTPQSSAVGTAFSSPLSATVKDAGGNPVANVTVTFEPPASGASGSFAGNVKTAVTNSSGVATSAVFTANQTSGSYAVNATVPGVAAPAVFSLTNTAGTPATVLATSGTPQTAAINQPFGAPLVVTVKDGSNNPVPGVTVTFNAPATGPSGTFAAGVKTATTNSFGVATSAVFTANSVAGVYVVAATVSGGASPANFQLTNTPGPAAAITATSGSPQTAAINTSFAAPLVATVKDASGNPVPNVTVTFAPPVSGATGSFAGGVKTAQTNASGVATSAAFTANSIAGSYSVTASAPGVATPASFALTNSAGAPGSIQATSGTPQSAPVNTAFGQPLVVTVKDAGNNPVANVTVTFTAPATGPSGTFANGVNTAVTNASGIATSPNFTANAIAGPYVVNAIAAGVASPAAFSLTNTPGAAASIEATGGTPQAVAVTTAYPNRLSALVKDASGNPVPNVTVTFAAPATGASATFAGGVSTAVTNASGVATSAILTANTVAGAYSVTATAPGVAGSAPYLLTNLAGPAASIAVTSGTPQSSVINTPFAEPLVVTVKDTHGNPVPGATVSYGAPATGASGSFAGNANTAVTNSSGVASSAVFRANLIAGSYNVTASAAGVATPANFALTNLPGAVASVAVSGGNSQNTVVGTAFASPLAAVVKDAGGNPVPGITVTFTAPASGPGATFAGGAANATASTNASGIATSPVLTANDLAGTFVVSASATGAPSPVSFNLTNRPGPAAVIAMTSGSPQSAKVGSAFAAPLVATVQDSKGNPVPNVTVTYTAPADGASGVFTGGATAVTNTQGVATSKVFVANSTVGTYSVVATVPGVALGATFSLTNTPGAPASVVAVAGTPQSTVIKTAFATKFAAKVADSAGNPISGVTVVFNIPATGATGAFAGSDNTAVTDATGVATAETFTANSVAGSYSVLASVTGVATNATFALTNTHGPAATIAMTAGSPQSIAVGGTFPNKLTATVKDDSGNAVPNVVVTFTVPGTGASAVFAGGVNTATTNSTGVAVSAIVTANTTAGSYVVTAGTPGVATPAAFSLTNLPGAAAAIAAVSGTPQSVGTTMPYPEPFVAKVTDSFGNPIPNVKVTFNAPTTGPSGVFTNTNSANTNAAGIATSDVFTANLLSGNFVLTATAPGVATPANFNLTNLDGGGAAITLSSASVGKGLQAALTVTIPSPAPVGGKVVTITSANPGKLLVSGRAVELGTNQLVVTVPAGLTQLSGIYVQPQQSTGTVDVTASADGMLPGTATITMTPAGFVLAGPNGIGVPSFTVSKGINNTPLTVHSARLTPTGDFAEVQQVRGGTSVTIALTSMTPSIGTIAPNAVIGGGDSVATVTFNALEAGSTTLTAEVPLGFTLPGMNYNLLTANVTPTGLAPLGATVGQNLQTTTRVLLNGAAPSGGVTVTVTSNDPSKVLLSKTATGAGAASIALFIDQGFTRTPEFFVQALDKNATVTYTAQAPGFGSANGTILLAPSGFVLYSPGGFGSPFTTTSGAANQILTVYSALLDTSLNYVDIQPVRAGLTANVAVTSSNTTVGTITASPVAFTGNSSSATTQFDPQAGGTTTISISTPPGFSTPAQFISAAATVIQPNILPQDVTVGKNLQQIAILLLGQAAPSGGLEVTLTSSSANLKLSTGPSTVGANSITVTVPAGMTSAQYYVQAFSNTGSASYSASAPGYTTRSAVVTFAPSGVVLAGPWGFGYPLTTTVAIGVQPVTVSTVMLDSAHLPIQVMQLAAGLSLSVPLTNTTPSIGTVPASAVIAGGTDSKVVQFSPLAVGTTTLGVTQPAGYTLPSQYTALLAQVN